jgi:hypothetical protein
MLRLADRGSVVLLLALCVGACAAQPQNHDAVAVAVRDTFPPLHVPLDPPLLITATFGEFRPGHFHAALDFSTGHVTGQRVYAPLDGWVERARTSGGGYGRSLTLRSADGRSIVFGHLDAFADPLGAWMAARQDSSGAYEQDVMFPASAFPVRAGELIAWSGASGAGPAHLHMEVRRGDVAFNPLRAGMTIADSTPPVLTHLTLEPVGNGSWVARSPMPRTIRLGTASETLVVEGRVRAWVRAVDPGIHGSSMAPYETWVTWKGARLECRMDHVTWDDDMSAAEWVYDSGGRVAAGHPLGLWIAAGFHPVLFDSGGWNGEITVAPGDSGRALTLGARDVAGNEATRTVYLRGPRAAEVGPDSTRLRRAKVAASPVSSTLLALAPNAATASGQALAPFEWNLASGGAFDTATVVASWREAKPVASGLTGVGGELVLEPARMALRRAANVSVTLPAGTPWRGLGLYNNAGRGWRLVAEAEDSMAHTLAGTARALGRYALFHDTTPPRVIVRRPPLRAGEVTPYSHWAIEAVVAEQGSGIEPRACAFVVDGIRVPTEYDVDETLLRWRPRVAPAPGLHHYELVAVDRAGNQRRVNGTFMRR